MTQSSQPLLVVAFPTMRRDDAAWIDRFRAKHDPLYYGVVGAHFTLVFPTVGFAPDAFVDEVTARISGFPKFDFEIRCTNTNNDALSEYFHLFLVVDEGNSNLIRLHDQLYSGRLRPTWRMDIDFVPHIGIGNTRSAATCRELAAEANREISLIAGQVEQLSVIAYANRTVTTIAEIPLA